MGLSKSGVLAAVLITGALLGGFHPAFADDEDEKDRAARWKQLQESIFPHREVLDSGGIITVDAPPRALDAALVPVELQMPSGKPVKGVYLIIDDNPAPMAAHFVFGPKADPRDLKFRVRVNAYTNIHAIAETADGQLHAASRFVKAAGGCSAPAGSDEAAAMAELTSPTLDASSYIIEAPAEGDEEVTGYSPVIIAEATTSLKRLSVSEAVMELDLTGAACLVFQHGSSGRVNIIYRRADGNVGWVDPPAVTPGG